MLKNTSINREVIRRIALALGELNEQVVFVGGATVSLYVNDPAAEDVRPTKDVDISLAIASLGELEASRRELTRKGFKQSSEDEVICRFRYDDIKVDVMNTRAIGWAPANPWFAPGFAHREMLLVEDQPIWILPLPYFLASKFVAFNDRGIKDPRTSHDFEDIVYILDNQTEIQKLIKTAPADAQPYLRAELQKMLEDRVMQEAILGNLFYETRSTRLQIIYDRIRQILTED